MTITNIPNISSKQRKTIAIVTNSCWNIYNFRQELIRDLQQKGYKILVIAPVDEYVHYLNKMSALQHIPITKLQAHSRSINKDLKLLIELQRVYRKYKPDLILHFTIKPNIYGSIAASSLGIPSIATITGLGRSFLQAGWMTFLVGKLYKFAFRKIPQVLFHNPDDKDIFIRNQWLKPKKGIVVNGSGLNTTFYRPRKKPETGKFIFLFVGRLLNDKGIREFLQCSQYLQEVTERGACWVVGELDPQNPDTVNKQLLLEAIQKRHVRYFGKVSDVRSFIEKVDVVVLPSYREGMPRAILEAMSMGKPIITTDSAGCRQTINPTVKNGLLVPTRDTIALGQAMLQLYQCNEE
ncbi:MAG: glycosyltransferase family 4 protein, partial [Cyanothece sp. SIO1E1]|nr:glycosyltransferase family 4 protein [Cyanothece sp. SIO1E1]